MTLQSQTPGTLPHFELSRNAHGRLTMRLADGVEHVGVLPVRAYPISAPNEGLSLFGTDGHELVWIDRMDQLSAEQRTLIEEELAAREFVPTIQKLVSVSTLVVEVLQLMISLIIYANSNGVLN